MQKEFILDIASGIVVLGSVFGASHMKKIAIRIKKLLDPDKSLTKAAE